MVDGPLRVWGLSKFVERLVRPLFHSGTKVCVCVLKQLEYVGLMVTARVGDLVARWGIQRQVSVWVSLKQRAHDSSSSFRVG